MIHRLVRYALPFGCVLAAAVAASGAGYAWDGDHGDDDVTEEKRADLEVKKEAKVESLRWDGDKAKAEIVYKVKVENKGERSEDIFLFDCLPEDFEVKEISPHSACDVIREDCDSDGKEQKKVECWLDPLRYGEKTEVVIKGKVETRDRKLVNFACAFTDNERAEDQQGNCDTEETTLQKRIHRPAPY